MQSGQLRVAERALEPVRIESEQNPEVEAQGGFYVPEIPGDLVVDRDVRPAMIAKIEVCSDR